MYEQKRALFALTLLVPPTEIDRYESRNMHHIGVNFLIELNDIIWIIRVL